MTITDTLSNLHYSFSKSQIIITLLSWMSYCSFAFSSIVMPYAICIFFVKPVSTNL